MIKKEMCSGCGACAAICPKDAIRMDRNQKGFYHPVVDHKECIECSLCDKVCPEQTLKWRSIEEPIQSFAVVNCNDEIRNNSSSGGVFYELAKAVIEDGGVAFGVAWVNRDQASHIAVQSVDKLEQIMKSKYVQSNVSKIFRSVKQILETGKKTLFSGSPCQIAGLKNYLNDDYPNLITVDYICHGVPSPKALEKYTEFVEQCENSSVESYDFRTKKNGWHVLSLETNFNNKHTILEKASDNPYYRAFLSNLSLNIMCGACQFNCLPRTSDITLGDFWGINMPNPQFKDDKGVSCVIVNTEKGKELFEYVSSNFVYMQSSIAMIQKGNPFIDGHCSLHPRSEKFFQALDTAEPFDSIVNRLLKPTLPEAASEILKYKLSRSAHKVHAFKLLAHQKLLTRQNRKNLIVKNFSIISNNCWGGAIYQKYGLAYRSPTAGLYLLGHDFVKFVERLDYYLSCKLEFISWEKCSYYEVIKDNKPYPVARLDDIEIYFMHYPTEEEAAEKWYRRAKRINYDCILFKLSQREGCSKEDVKKFMSLPLRNKICFAYDEVEGTIHIPELKHWSGDETPLLEQYFDELKILNKL